MKSEDFSVWLSAISGMSGAQRAEALTALEKSAADAGSSMRRRRANGARTRWERPASSGSSVRVVRIAPGGRSSAGAVRTGCCDIAARVAGALSTR